MYVCDVDKVNIYDGLTYTITVSEEAVLKGSRCPRNKFWRITLKAQVTGRESLNSLYTIPTSASVLDHTERCNTNHAVRQAINNVYNLLRLELAVQYLYMAAGFPTK